MTCANPTKATTAGVVTKASAISRGSEVGRRTTDAMGNSATTEANSNSGMGRTQLIRQR
jgi:hypothetical protein